LTVRTHTSEQSHDPVWGDDEGAFRAVARNVSTRYVAYAIDAALGVVMLPFNLAHLGKPLYGLWILTASLTTSFALLDLGYSGSSVRFIARYRALRDREGLNQILSTLFVVYSGIGASVLCAALIMSGSLDTVFKINPADVSTSRYVLLIISGYIAVRFSFSVYGGVIVGFQRYHVNNVISIMTSVAVAAVNVAALMAGAGLVGLVASTTAVRIVGLFLYRRAAHRVFPALSIRIDDFSRQRLREVSGFSVYMLLFDLGCKLNFSSDTLVLGAFLGTPAVALWAPAQRLTELLTKLSNQLNDALFPHVVESDTARRTDRLRSTFIQGTQLSLAMAIPLAGGVAIVAHPLIRAWVGPSFSQTATILQMLAALVVLRAGNSTSSTILKGAGEHKRLTAYVAVTGVGNLALSIALVKPYGMIGVAIGTVLPIVIMSMVATFPTACRRVGVPLSRAFREAVWPALWPAVVLVVCLKLTESLGPPRLIVIGAKLLIAGVLYELLFFGVAVGRDARQKYIRKVRELIPRPLLFRPAKALVPTR
jgi:O-antigen/teichoic acid export membrane protein